MDFELTNRQKQFRLASREFAEGEFTGVARGMLPLVSTDLFTGIHGLLVFDFFLDKSFRTL